MSLQTCTMLRPWVLIILFDLQLEAGVKDASEFGIAHVGCRFNFDNLLIQPCEV